MKKILNSFLDAGKADEAYSCFEKTFELLPEPKEDWEAYSWLRTSMGECRFIDKNYESAYDLFRAAYNSSANNANPYILIRLGECCAETEREEAIEFLLRAYMLEGKHIFKNESKLYSYVIRYLIRSNTKTPVYLEKSR